MSGGDGRVGGGGGGAVNKQDYNQYIKFRKVIDIELQLLK